MTFSNNVPIKVPNIPTAEKVNPILISTVPVLRRRRAPASAAEPTMIVELVVAAVAERPRTATNPGTARIAPPAPINPRVAPTVAPSRSPKILS